MDQFWNRTCSINNQNMYHDEKIFHFPDTFMADYSLSTRRKNNFHVHPLYDTTEGS